MHGNSKSLYWENSDKSFVIDYKSLDNKFYVRISANNPDDKEKALKEAEKRWGKLRILHRDNESENEAAFITESVNEEKFESDCAELAKIADIKGKIRVLDY